VATADPDGVLERVVALRERCARAVERRRAEDPDPHDAFRGLYVSDVQAATLTSSADGPPLDGGLGPAPEPQTRLAGLALTPFDTELLVIAMAPDLDPRFERVYGYLHDDVTRRRASIGLALELAGSDPTDAMARARLTAGAPLLARHLVVVEDDDRPVLTRSLRVPDRVSAHLLGDDAPDAALAPYRRAARLLDDVGPGRAALARARSVHLFRRQLR